MPTRIKKLTKKQEEAIPAHVAKWIEIGLRTGETDWDTFDKYMPVCYQKAKIAYPKKVIRVQSPIVGAFAACIAEGILRNRYGAVDVAVRGAVDVAVGEAVDGAVDVALKKIKLRWHYWIGGQFWVGGWYFGSPAYVAFFTDVCNLKLSANIMERATAYRRVCESVNYIWPNRDFVMVCAKPSAIYRDTQGRLHNEHGMSIRYPDGWGLYHLHGVRFEEVLYFKVVNREMVMKEILAITDIDQRVQAMKFAKDGLREWYASAGGKRIATYTKYLPNKKPVNYELWRIPKGKTFTKDVTFAVYDCPTAVNRGEKREYAKGVPDFTTVPEAMSWGMSSDDVTVSPHDWELMEPLVSES